MTISQTSTHDFVATPVDATDFTELTLVNEDSSTTQIIKDEMNAIEYKNESGSIIELCVGPTGQSGAPYTVIRVGLLSGGSEGAKKLTMSKGLSVYIRALDATADHGMLTLNLLRGRK